jgi:hypothetical protein
MQPAAPSLRSYIDRACLFPRFGFPRRRWKSILPGAQIRLLDAGHFALDTAADEIAALVRNFV